MLRPANRYIPAPAVNPEELPRVTLHPDQAGLLLDFLFARLWQTGDNNEPACDSRDMGAIQELRYLIRYIEGLAPKD